MILFLHNLAPIASFNLVNLACLGLLLGLVLPLFLRKTKFVSFYLALLIIGFASCKDEDDCALIDCGVNQVCVEGVCECAEGWTGTLCEQAICNDNTCTNGSCNEETGECECEDGFSGENCDIEIVSFEKVFEGNGESYGTSGQQTIDGGYILTGQTKSIEGEYFEAYIVKTDSNGDEIWNRTYGGGEYDIGNSVQQTIDGGFILTGQTTGSGNSNIYLLKTDNNGNETWSKNFGGMATERGYSMQQTLDGGFIITGLTQSFGNGSADVYLIKTDSNGNEMWTKTFGELGYDFALDVEQTDDGGFILTGVTTNFEQENDDIYLVKTDSNGDEMWSNTFGGINSGQGESVQQTTDGGYIIGGRLSPGFGLVNAYLVKTDSNGEELWNKTLGGTEPDACYGVQQTTDGGYILTGRTKSFGNGSSDVYLVKTDGNGNEMWSKTFGGTDFDQGESVQQTTDGGYIIIGNKINVSSGKTNIYLIKTDPNGNL